MFWIIAPIAIYLVYALGAFAFQRTLIFPSYLPNPQDFRMPIDVLEKKSL